MYGIGEIAADQEKITDIYKMKEEKRNIALKPLLKNLKSKVSQYQKEKKIGDLKLLDQAPVYIWGGQKDPEVPAWMVKQ